MKKSALLLFGAMVMINAVTAQQTGFQQEATTNNIKAQNKLSTSDYKIKLDSVVISTRSSDSEPWIRSNKKTYEYDNELRLDKITTTSGLYDWADSYGIVRFVYNSAGLVDSLQFYTKNDYKMSDMRENIKYNYDSSGRLYQSVDIYDKGTLQDRKTYSYNESGKLSEIIWYEEWWAPWTAYHRFSYNPEGKVIEYKEDSVYGILATYEWNSDGNLITENYENWGQKRKHIFFYDADGNRVKSEHNYGSSKRTKEYTYLEIDYQDLVDLHLSLLNISNEIDEIEYCPKNLISTITEKIENGSTGSLPEFQKSVYYYSPLLSTGIPGKTISDIRLFPNPASDHITFTWQANYPRLNLKIFSLLGSCIIESEISSQEMINLNKLPKGIYLYQLSEKMQLLKTGKLVIE